ncbi:hypothetical protein A2856_03530 [Candidatus Uhrbacteria bacterium RIFCSPHIGHO2_01_FULL_63_20]|uniref:Peptidase M16 N-terminal domain-containing protein n=1 Tax=Candidatus Uhrbacteria bacterium RIFCSPHIGHO2_01_FULL_63_20 TaxID=1802385 RepID=A0A1F7TKX2_9BACT|nr:MAG: hypothetical protein A2856_03530 [Candidatus Uhrbacteria bacterium RIFCSPHIGHO2_01_FULL_63_20]
MDTTFFDRYPMPTRRTVLDNGLTVLTTETGSKFAYCELVIETGGVHDDPDCQGAAHFLEHIVSGGEGRNDHPLLLDIWKKGVRFNASTSDACTSYHLEGLAEDIDEMITILFKMVFEPTITSAGVEAERSVIRAEYHRRRPAFEIDRWRFEQMFAPESPWRHLLPIGDEAGIEAIDVGNLQSRWARDYYPENMALIVTGGIAHQRVLDLSATFSVNPTARKRKERIKSETRFVEAELVQPIPSMTPVVQCYWKYQKDGRFIHPVDDVRTLLTHGRLGLLYKRLRTDLGKAYAVSSRQEKRHRQLWVETQVSIEDVGVVAQEARRALRDIVSNGISTDDWQVMRRLEQISLHAEEDGYRGPRSYPIWADFLQSAWMRNHYGFGAAPEETPMTVDEVIACAEALSEAPYGQLVIRPG